MSDNGDLREDLKIPDGEIGQQLKAEYDNGKELLVSSIVYHLALNMCGLFLLKIIVFGFILNLNKINHSNVYNLTYDSDAIQVPVRYLCIQKSCNF